MKQELASCCSGTRVSERVLVPLIQLTHISLFTQDWCTNIRRRNASSATRETRQALTINLVWVQHGTHRN